MRNELAEKISHANSNALYEVHLLSMGAETVQSRDLMTIIGTANRKIIELCDAEIKRQQEAPPPMLAILRDRHGDEQGRITLKDEDYLDCDHYASRFADLLGFEIDFNKDEVPDGCEDYSVTLTGDPLGVRCWKSENYMILE